ncbi:DUF427 domain-containing protein [Dactylosporangium sp. NPDC005555]|uniref:DUF427 domain-containing protein n=1 Tax=Dactylosporangium sp. NPDC005555 TaxID=3154889 RepID=UPI00339DD18E
MTADFPKLIVPVDHTEPVPRRVRAMLGGRTVLSTTRAVYLWESPAYPQYYIPAEDLDRAAVVDEDHVQRLKHGSARRIGLRVGDVDRPAAGRIYTDGPVTGLARLEWDSLDAWFEEDEQVFVHPRNPYSRVDALRSTRTVRVSLDGVILAGSSSPVLVFETGLPTRYYLNRTDVDFTRLEASPTRSSCPYKGRTTDSWSARINGTAHQDIAWAYNFPTAALTPIAGLVAFYNEKVDIQLDGRVLDRPSATA